MTVPIHERVTVLTKRLMEDKINEKTANDTAVLLLECFENHKGFLKAERVYATKVCLPTQFKAWRKTLITMGYVIHPEHVAEPWKHYPGAKMKDLVPYFEELPVAMSVEEQFKDIYKCIKSLEKRLSLLEPKNPYAKNRTNNWGRTG
jgi:hypothetical protein